MVASLKKDSRAAAFQLIKDYYSGQGIENPNWLWGTRCRFMMDAWNVLGPPNHEVTPAHLRAANLTSADSQWLGSSGRHAIVHLGDLVRKCMTKLMLPTPPPSPSPPDAKDKTTKEDAPSPSQTTKEDAPSPSPSPGDTVGGDDSKEDMAEEDHMDEEDIDLEGEEGVDGLDAAGEELDQLVSQNDLDPAGGQAILGGNPNVGKKEVKVGFTLEEFKNDKVAFHLDSGLIKQCPEPCLQAIHIDDKTILEWNITSKIWMGEVVALEEWLHCGYVIDLPLSKEGSWLRVAIPDPKNKQFLMEWIMVPFGCFLVRSMALWHSGHSGSTGNTRFHATFTVDDKNRKADSAHLAYFYKLGHNPLFHGWKLAWSDKVPPECRNSKGYLRHPDSANNKRFGAGYFNKGVKMAEDGKFYHSILNNLNPYKFGLERQEKARVKNLKANRLKNAAAAAQLKMEDDNPFGHVKMDADPADPNDPSAGVV